MGKRACAEMSADKAPDIWHITADETQDESPLNFWLTIAYYVSMAKPQNNRTEVADAAAAE